MGLKGYIKSKHFLSSDWDWASQEEAQERAQERVQKGTQER